MHFPRFASRLPLLCLFVSAIALHDDVVQAAATEPIVAGSNRPASANSNAAPNVAPLSLEAASNRARVYAYDVLIAKAQAKGLVGDQRAIATLPNPVLMPQVGRVIGYDPAQVTDCSGCSAWAYQIGLSDQGLLSNLLIGKQQLRSALVNAVKERGDLDRKEAERQIVAIVKTGYVAAAVANRTRAFVDEVAQSYGETVALSRKRYPALMDEGQLARIETAALGAEADRDRAARDEQAALLALYLPLGLDPDRDGALQVDPSVLHYRVPSELAQSDVKTLSKQAGEGRSDVLRALAEQRRADTAKRLATRERVPDMALSLQYAQTGTGQNSVSPPTLSVGLTIPIPVADTRQGPIMRADADIEAANATRSRTHALAASEVQSAYAGFVAARDIVLRYENAMLGRAKTAKTVTETQYRAGSASLIDYLDSTRSYIQTNKDYIQALGDYWTEVFLLEAALGTEFHE